MHIYTSFLHKYAECVENGVNMKNFSDKLAKAILEKRNPTVMGLDPKLDFIPEEVKAKAAQGAKNDAEAIGNALFAFNRGLIDATCDIVAAVKPQLAYYEMYGTQGIRAFAETIAYAAEKGLVVITDGKRNDIGTTAEAYSAAHLGPNAFVADALTVNGYLGSDGITPFLKDCGAYGKGIFVLVKTSNPSSGQLQDLLLADGRMVSEAMADLVNEWGAGLVGECGYSSVGAVVGATWPKQLADMRRRMPKAWILVPGYGAQGGTAADVAAAFDERGLGAVVNASRSLMCAYKSDKWKSVFTPGQYAEACRAEAIRMRDDILEAAAERNGREDGERA